MIAVIFEVEPHSDKRQAYLDLASELRPLLMEIEGFISVERFESLTQPGKILSLSFWRDEEAIAAWRRSSAHRKAQSIGRKDHFKDYRLRIAGVIRDYGITERAQVPADSQNFHH